MPSIFLVGCGVTGTMIVHAINEMRIPLTETIAIDIDPKSPETVKADRKILLSKTFFGDPEFGWSEPAGTGENGTLPFYI